MPDLGAPELLVIVAVMFVLFGSRKPPDAARSLGRSLRIFRAEMRGLDDAGDQLDVGRPGGSTGRNEDEPAGRRAE